MGALGAFAGSPDAGMATSASATKSQLRPFLPFAPIDTLPAALLLREARLDLVPERLLRRLLADLHEGRVVLLEIDLAGDLILGVRRAVVAGEVVVELGLLARREADVVVADHL